MKKLLILSLSLIFPLSSLTMNSSTNQGINKTQAAQIGGMIIAGPVIYGLGRMAYNKFGKQKFKTICAGIVTLVLGASTVSCAVDLVTNTNPNPHEPRNPILPIAGGLMTCILGKQVIEDIQNWN